MNYVNKKDVEKYFSFYYSIEDRVYDVYKKLLDLGIKKDSYLLKHGTYALEEDIVILEADEYWNYGGYGHHYESFPVKYLYDDSWILELEEKKKQREYKKRLELEKKHILQETEERKKYEELKKKFGE